MMISDANTINYELSKKINLHFFMFVVVSRHKFSPLKNDVNLIKTVIRLLNKWWKKWMKVIKKSFACFEVLIVVRVEEEKLIQF